MLEIRETAGIARRREPVTCGVPLPRGWLREPVELHLEAADGSRLPVQATPLTCWPDGSVKWCLLDFQVTLEPRSARVFEPRRGELAASREEILRVEREGNGWTIDTGAAVIEIESTTFPGLAGVRTGETDQLGGVSSLTLTDARGREFRSRVRSCGFERQGRLRATLRLEGAFDPGAGDSITVGCRFHAHAGHRFLLGDLSVRNRAAAQHPGGFWDLGDAGSFLIDDLSLRLPLARGGDHELRYSVDGGAGFHASKDGDCRIEQDSSGGERWNSTNHVDARGRVTTRWRGFRVEQSGRVVLRGERAVPVLHASSPGGSSCTVTVPEFWQNFPKSLGFAGATVRIGLLPSVGERRFHELQGGEQTNLRFVLEFAGDEDCLRWVHAPLVPVLSPDWIRETGVFRHLPRRVQPSPWEAWLHGVVKGPRSFFARREIVDEYGWRHFGDLYADHEAVGHQGPHPLVSHYNNQYDPIFSFFRQFVLRGDPRWFQLADEASRHVRNVDIYHTRDDRPEYNGGMFWHTEHYQDASTCSHRSFSKDHTRSYGEQTFGGGPSPEHCYTRGLAQHFLFTGDPDSKDAVLEVAEWIRSVHREPSTILATLHAIKRRWRGTGWGPLARFLDPASHPLSRAGGNAIETLLDAFQLTGERDYLTEAEGVIRGCAGPGDRIDERDLLNAELCWSYTVCLAAIGRYLEVKRELQEFDDEYSRAQSTLLRYARWMLENEYHYLDRSERLEFPNETWAAQDLRKSRILFLASEHAEPQEAERLTTRAISFFEEAIEQLRSFDSATLTRPLVLLLQNQEVYLCFRDGSAGGREPFPRRPWNVGPSMNGPNAQGFTRALLRRLRHVARRTSLRREIEWIRSRVKARQRT